MTRKEKNLIDARQSLLDYHRTQMSDRRAIGFRAFLALVGMYLVSIKGSVEIIGYLDDPIRFKWIMIAGCLLLFLFFVMFLVQIEGRSKADRIKYLTLETDIFRMILGEERLPPRKETCWQTLRISWASTWPSLAGLVLLIATCAVIWQIKTQ